MLTVKWLNMKTQPTELAAEQYVWIWNVSFYLPKSFSLDKKHVLNVKFAQSPYRIENNN